MRVAPYAVLLFLVRANAAAPPAVGDLLSRMIAAENAQEPERAHYIYREHAENFRLDGKLRHSSDYEWIYLEGQPYRKLVAYNGKPLKGKRAAEEERHFQMTRAQRRTSDALRKPNPHIVSAGIEPAAVVRLMTHKVSGEELIRGRPTWVVESEPGPDVEQARSAKDRVTLCYKTTMWIDQEDYAIAQIRWEVIREGPEVLPGSFASSTFERLAPALWLRSVLAGEFSSGPPHPTDHWKQTHHFSDYHRFGTQSNVSFDAPTTKLPN